MPERSTRCTPELASTALRVAVGYADELAHSVLGIALRRYTEAREPRLMVSGNGDVVSMWMRGAMVSGNCTYEKPPGADISSASAEKCGADAGMATKEGKPAHGDDTFASS